MSICRYVCPPLSTLPLCIPRYYGGVVLVGVGAMATNMYFASRVMKARKEHNVEVGFSEYTDFPFKYPLLYHPTNNLFNCIQRGHQNYLEVLPLFLMFLFVGGLRYPRTFTACGSIFLIGRILYFKGYATGGEFLLICLFQNKCHAGMQLQLYQ
ncbi:hypothetical protein AHF37_04207 [Paragonimus kellicotti]|nr:hypothetical protein AHF37_04207 [Paragonimus kellicotti]